MYKKFKVWLEEKEEGDNHLKNMLLRRLGFEPRAMNAVTIKIRDLDRDRVKKAISSMGLAADAVQNLQNFVDSNPDTTLQNLLDQMSDLDIDNEDDVDVPSQKADLPKGQKQPLPNQISHKAAMLPQQPPDMGAAMSSYMGQYGERF